MGEGQQVRLAREQMQRCHLELRETQQQLMQVQREADRLALELDESIQLSHEKVTMKNGQLKAIKHKKVLHCNN